MIRNSIFPILVAVILAGCNQQKAEVPDNPIRPVKVVEVAPVAASRELEFSGAVRARYETAAGFRIAGKIVARNVDIGDHVQVGQILARADATDYKLAVDSATAAVTANQRQVETADLALKRAQQLFAGKWVAQAQLDQAQLAYNQATANRDAASAQLEQARNQVDYTELKADRAGIVTAISAEAGQVVAAGSPVVTISADGDKEVAIAVPETDILAFHPGQLVEVGLWSDATRKLNGTVREVAGSADPASRTFAVRVSLPADERVLIGMTASVRASEPTVGMAYNIPLTALAVDDQNKDIVWTVAPGDQTVHARSVSVGAFSDTGVQIASGLGAGDLVVVAGTQFMTENLKVKLPSPSAEEAYLPAVLAADNTGSSNPTR